jgi:DNA repair exonuclease SbcCD ATPase subunit
MANTFGILAAVALLFALFVSFKNKSQLEDIKATIATEDSKKARQTSSFNTLLEEIEALEGEKEGYDNTKTETLAALEKQNAANTELDKEIATAKSAANAAQQKADSAEDLLKELGDIGELIPKMKRLASAINELDDEISINAAKVDRLQGVDTSVKTKVAGLKKQLSDRTSGSSYFEATKVDAVFRQYGFVTLAGGDDIGVVKKSKLSVLREGEEIAQLLVTGVESTSAAANIIPSSLNGDVTVNPGDTVVPVAEEAAAN